MSNYARIVNGQAVDVSSDPEKSFHPDIAKLFESVPASVQPGWMKGSTGKWKAPEREPEAAPKPEYPKVGAIHFQMLFTAAETVAAQDLKASDKVLASFWRLIDDPRTTEVNLGLQVVQGAIEYTLEAIKASGVELDVVERKAAILSGILR
jgi:hypothetical protein